MIYELRTYTLVPGKQGEYLKLSGDLSRKIRGDDYGKLEGFWSTEFGTLNQLVHLWKFDDDADRRAHWKAVFANKDFVEGFAVKFRPLLASQEVKLLTAAPWGPHP